MEINIFWNVIARKKILRSTLIWKEPTAKSCQATFVGERFIISLNEVCRNSKTCQGLFSKSFLLSLKKKFLSFSVIQVTHRAVHFPCIYWRTAECSGYNVTGSPLTSFFKEVRECLSNLEEITLLRESDFSPQQRHGCPSCSWFYLSSPLAPGRRQLPRSLSQCPWEEAGWASWSHCKAISRGFCGKGTLTRTWDQLWNMFKVKCLFLSSSLPHSLPPFLHFA